MPFDRNGRAEPARPYPGALLPLLAALLLLAHCGSAVGASDAPVHGYRVVASWPHDPGAFTQGLAIADGVLYESTGGYGRSSVRRVDLKTGRVLQHRALPDKLFGEGLTVWGDELVQLTWRAGKILRYDRRMLTPLGEHGLAGEGWGLTHDGRSWIISDGTATLRFLDPQTGAERHRVEVRGADGPVRLLNELESVPVLAESGEGGRDAAGGRVEIWANIWHSDRVVRIHPADGRVLGYIDLSGLWPRRLRPHTEAVLNGLAYDPELGHLLVTGKLWPKIYSIAVPGLVPGPDGLR
jgi:glutamine cyclotransferase